MRKPIELICLILAFWPTWTWYTSRIFDSSDEPWGLVALFTAVYFLFRGRTSSQTTGSPHPLGLLLLVAYIAAFAFAPNLILSMIVILILWFVLPGGRSLQNRAGICGLLFISLPLIPSLNFYAGYPLRLITSAGAALMLNCLGLSASQDGTMLTVQNKLIAIDAPCSGISMLWASAYVTLLLATLFKLRWQQTIMLGLASSVTVILGNILRAATLVVYDAITPHFKAIDLALLEPQAHVSIGLLVFAMTTVATVLMARMVLRRSQADGGTDLANAVSTIAEVTNASATIGEPAKTSPPIGGVFSFLSKPRFQSAQSILGVLLIPLCLVAAAFPFLVHPGRSAPVVFVPPVWPTQIAGNKLLPVPALAEETAFARDFPGAMKRFTDGKSAYFVREINKETRQLHPSNDCFRGMNYTIEFRPIVCTRDGARWNSFLATKDGQSYLVMERFFDQHGQSWTDVSAWYWAAALGRSRGPWWAVTMATPVQVPAM